MSRSLKFTSAVLVALLMSACGGGSDPPPANFDVATAVTGIAKANEVFTLNGSLAGAAATYKVTHIALPDAAFATFAPLLTVFRRAATISSAGSSATVIEDDFVDLATRSFYGLIDTDGNRALSTTRAPYPATATIGNSGLLYDATYYDAASTAIGKTHVHWSLEAVAGSRDTAYLCVNVDFLDLNGAASGEHENHCYRIAANGDRLGMRVTLVSPSLGTLVFQ
jgi:hypothetical protein